MVKTCSPFIAIHTTYRAVLDAEAGEGAVNAAKKKMYVDDYLGSARNVEEGLKESSVVRKVLADADLHFQGWISNSVTMNVFGDASEDAFYDHLVIIFLQVYVVFIFSFLKVLFL